MASCVRQVQQKGDHVSVGERVRLIHKRRSEVAATRAPKGKSSGADAKSEQPVCAAAAVTLGDLQKMELLALLAKRFHVEVTVGFGSSPHGFRLGALELCPIRSRCGVFGEEVKAF
jgi:hypothetical protein